MEGTFQKGELGELGVVGSQVHLLDAVPLVAMCWADGKVEAEEREELEAFIQKHIERVNTRAGRELVTERDAERFLSRFLSRRPPDWLLRRLTALLPEVNLASDDDERNHERLQAILGGCLDIGSAAPSPVPFSRRFSAEEKAWYEGIARTLQQATPSERRRS